MGQILGVKRTIETPNPRVQSQIASAEATDGSLNIGLQVVTYSGPLTMLIDKADATYIYIGEAAPGTTQATAKWRIYRVPVADKSSLMWAYVPAAGLLPDQRAGFDHVWTARKTLAYS